MCIANAPDHLSTHVVFYSRFAGTLKFEICESTIAGAGERVRRRQQFSRFDFQPTCYLHKPPRPAFSCRDMDMVSTKGHVVAPPPTAAIWYSAPGQRHKLYTPDFNISIRHFHTPLLHASTAFLSKRPWRSCIVDGDTKLRGEGTRSCEQRQNDPGLGTT